ncbi:hypothetical protein ACD591_07565 [Rufibacter glacialis]|uniref:Uncharacterized protein n=1 Tax=Rufibacter glacialis TaxID=1259555 RepID=A0A5M8QBW9_9BACT|nr:hypothetical protein [Rufibacter glacialis]KAA6433497.1 hypothetical protein FOE74_13610 [Rufibacter glacialis]GGK73640.1 hypothetical protein GCM10011405_22180 [Rufibacter glacialis]
MSELTNPLFDDPREFLERQKEEYKNALLSDVTELKDQSQQIGKNLAIAGGILAGIYFLSRAFSNKKEAKPKKKKSNRLENPARFKSAEDRAWISSIPDVEDDEPLYSAIERSYPAVYHPSTGTQSATFGYRAKRKDKGSSLKEFFQSDLFKILEQQLAALAMVYLTKLIEQHLKAPAATQPILVEETTTLEYELQPDDITDAQSPQSPPVPYA